MCRKAIERLRKNSIEQGGLQICKRRVLKVRKASKIENNTVRRKKNLQVIVQIRYLPTPDMPQTHVPSP